jgi:hypothetical protein
MLWIIGVVLFAIWVLSLLFEVASGLIHIALVAAVIFFAWGFIRGRTATSTP